VCNINAIFNKNGKETDILTSLINVMTYNSFKSNKDGDGAIGFTKNKIKIHKSVSKIKYEEKYRTIISHQRFATGGEKDVINVHPHIGKRFLLIHNGVLSNMGDNKLCDSGHFLRELETKLGEEENIYEKLKQYLSTISGTFSMFLWDKKYKQLYYFKEFSTNMYFAENEDWLIMSTLKDNMSYACWLLNIDANVAEIKHNTIWKVSTKGEFKSLGEFEKKQIEYKSNYYGYGGYSYISSKEKQTTLKEKTYEEICEENKDVIKKALDFIREVKNES
jgi:predicted glutamine amidotransferase